MTPILLTAMVMCTNLNWEHSARCNAPVESFTQHEWGFSGQLTTGVEFSQVKIRDDLQYFRMEEVSWWVTSRGVIEIE